MQLKNEIRNEQKRLAELEAAQAISLNSGLPNLSFQEVHDLIILPVL